MRLLCLFLVPSSRLRSPAAAATTATARRNGCRRDDGQRGVPRGRGAGPEARRRRAAADRGLDPDKTYRLVVETNCGIVHDRARPEDRAKDGRIARLARRERLLRRHDVPSGRPRLRHPGRRSDRDGRRRARVQDRRRAAERCRVHEGRRRDGEERRTRRRALRAASSSSSPARTSACRPEYAVVGKVTDGMVTVEAIEALGTGDGPPSMPVVMERVTVQES